MFIAWFVGYIFFSIYMVHFSGWGYVTDFSAVFFWTGLFAFVTSLTFVPLTIKLFNKLSFKKKVLFPIITLLVSQIALTILLLPFTGLRPFEMGAFYFFYAAIIGLAFGLFYIWFQTKNFFSDKSRIVKKVVILSSPIILLLFLFYLFPYLSPSIAFKYFGDTIKDKAIEIVLIRYKAGDKLKDLSNQLPGFIESTNDKGSAFGSTEKFTYNIEFEHGFITKMTLTNNVK